MKIIYPATAITQEVARLGQEINRDYAEITEPLLLVVVLQGAMIFAADLMRTLTIPCTLACVRASSYRQSTSAGELVLDLGDPADHGDILIIEDIVDTGQTAQALLNHFRTEARSVHLCTLLDKPKRRKVEVLITYCGFVLAGDPFVIGYGLDYHERYRELPYIADFTPPAS